MKKLFFLVPICLLLTITAISQSKKEWAKVQSLNSWNAYQQFIISYPDGKYTEEAKQKQSLLKQPEVVKKGEEKIAGTEVQVAKNTIAKPTEVSTDGKQILIKKGRYYVDEKPLKGKELKNLLKSDAASAVDFKKSRATATVGYILEVPTILILMPMIGYLPGALGGILVATPFMIVSSKQLKKSIEKYNSNHSISPLPALKK